MKNTFGKQEFAVVLVSLLRQGAMVLSVVLSQIAAEFNQIPVTYIKILVSVNTIAIFPTLFLADRITAKLGLRKTVLLGAMLIIIGGAMPFFLYNYALIFFSRIVLGFGMGLLTPLSATVVTDNYEGEMKTRLIGMRTTAANAGNMLLSLFSGLLIGLGLGWRWAMLSYLVGVPAWLFMLWFLPKDVKKETKDSPDREQMRADHPAQERSSIFTVGLVYYTILMIMLIIFSSSMNMNISLYLSENRIGSGSTASILSMLLQFASSISSLMLTWVVSTFKRNTIPVSFIVQAAGILICALSNSLLGVILGTFVCGLGTGVSLTTVILRASESAPLGKATLGVSVVSAGIYIGQLASPVIIDFLSSALLAGNARSCMLVGGCALLITAVLGAVFANVLRPGGYLPADG